MGFASNRWLPGLLAAVCLVAAPDPGPDLRSNAALVLDQRTGETLYQKRPDNVLPIASITKLVTAMVVLDAGLDPKERIRIEPADVDSLRHSRSRLPVGTVLVREEALLLALMASENRAAHALGRTFPGGPEAFVAAMNLKARTLGLADTRFVDPAGLDCGNVSSARDLAALVEAAWKYPAIRHCSTREETTILAGRRSITFRNSNRLVRSPHWEIGLSKTGFIEEAGRCLVMQAKVARRPVVIVLLDSTGKLTRFGDANRIRRWIEGFPAAGPSGSPPASPGKPAPRIGGSPGSASPSPSSGRPA